MGFEHAIVDGLENGYLKPSQVGLTEIEVRYYADHTVEVPEDKEVDTCELVSVTYTDDGKRTAPHCDNAYTDERSDTIEGIGGEYATTGDRRETFSYVNDDKDLVARLIAVLDGPAVSAIIGR
jgi:hypothetical protein